MQGTCIFRRDWTMQVIKCTPWSTGLRPHPTIIKKMKTILEVEGKMGPAPANQFRPPLPNTNPNVRKDNAVEKSKRAAPKRFRPAAPKLTTMHPPLPEAPPKPRIMYLTADQFQFMRAPHGLVQAKSQATYLKTGTGYSHQTI